jgi:hypothetical protein
MKVRGKKNAAEKSTGTTKNATMGKKKGKGKKEDKFENPSRTEIRYVSRKLTWGDTYGVHFKFTAETSGLYQ